MSDFSIFEQLAGKGEIPQSQIPRAEPQLIYVDKDGLYGDADGIFLLRMADLSPEQREFFEEAKDGPINLFELLREWRSFTNFAGTVHQIFESGSLQSSTEKRKKGWRK